VNYWLLTTEYPPFYGGGIGTYCYYTARMLAGAGCHVTVFVADDKVRDREDLPEEHNIRIIRFNSDRNKLSGSLGYTARLSYAFADIVRTLILEDGKPHYIEAQDYLGIAYYLSQFKHLGYSFMTGIPLLLTLHSPAFVYLDYNRVPLYRFPDFWTCEMEKQAIISADLLISPTRFLVEEIGRQIDLTGRPIRILPNPYQPDQPPVDAPAHIPGKIIYYGKLSPQKGSFELMEYFTELWDEGFPHPLHIVGGTDIVFHPEQRTMGQLIHDKYKSYQEKGLLLLQGQIQPDWIKDTLQYAHLVIVPSIVDNMPYVVIEAMCLGKIVLASIQGGQPEIIEDGETGFLFDHKDPPSFARQLHKILALPVEEIQRIGANASRKIHASYGYDTIGPQKLALLKEITDEAHAGQRPPPAGKASHYFPFVHQEPIAALSVPDDQPLTGPSELAGQPLTGTSVQTDKLLSVVIPYFNMGRFIGECLHSVLNSTYQDLEVIIIDDGSTDPVSIQQLEKLGGDPRITLIRQKNHGLAYTRNQGAQTARGAWLAFLDADDKVSTTYYEKCIHALQHSDNVFFAGSWVQYFGDSHKLWPTFTPQPPYALVHNPVNSSGLVYKRTAFLTGGLNDKKADYGMEDYDSVISMLRHGFNGVVIPEPLFHYRVRKGSMFRQATPEKLLYSNRYIAEKNKDYYARFATQVINILNANGPGYQFDNPTFGVRSSTVVQHDNRLVQHLKAAVKKSPRLKRFALTIKNKLNF
jgi:glycosyltransferase involved in cell wall biosynthesis